MRKNRVDVITMGCSKNLIDSERLMRQFAESGYTVRHNPDKVEGEIVVVNTCGFIESAKKESIDMILEVVSGKSSGQVGQVYVMGCLSERYRGELREAILELDGIYGKFDWKDLITHLGKAYHSTVADLRLTTTPDHYAFLKIAEGCSRQCAYCAIPIITGRHVSRPEEEILEEVRGLAASGVRELLVIAQDLTYYGRDLYGEPRLPELIEKICRVDGIEWVRLHYGYPAQFPMDLLRVMREQPKVCKYLDIALQHASDHMLRVMRRGVTRQETEELLRRMREEVPGIAIRTTLMVGHPEETDEDFEELMDFVREQRFERMGAFMYSHEEGTYDYRHYSDNVPQKVKEERYDRLMTLQQEIALETAESMVGKTLKVLVDREEEGHYVGRTEYDSPDVDPEVILTGEARVGEFCQVRITDIADYDLIGEVLCSESK